jgi:hypothetical protein
MILLFADLDWVAGLIKLKTLVAGFNWRPAQSPMVLINLRRQLCRTLLRTDTHQYGQNHATCDYTA